MKKLLGALLLVTLNSSAALAEDWGSAAPSSCSISSIAPAGHGPRAANVSYRIEGTLTLERDTCGGAPASTPLGVTATINGKGKASVPLGDGRVAKGKVVRGGGISVQGKKNVGNGVKLVDKLVTGPLVRGSQTAAALSLNYKASTGAKCEVVFSCFPTVR